MRSNPENRVVGAKDVKVLSDGTVSLLARQLRRAENRLIESLNKYGAIDVPQNTQPSPRVRRRLVRAVPQGRLIKPTASTQMTTVSIDVPLISAVAHEVRVKTDYTSGRVLNIFGTALSEPFAEFFKSATELHDRLTGQETSPETLAKIALAGDIGDGLVNAIPSVPIAIRQLLGAAALVGADAADGKDPSLQTLNSAASSGGVLRGLAGPKPINTVVKKSPSKLVEQTVRQQYPLGQINRDGTFPLRESVIFIKGSFYNVRVRPGPHGGYEIFGKNNRDIPGIPVHYDQKMGQWKSTLREYAVAPSHQHPSAGDDGLMMMGDRRYIEMKQKVFPVVRNHKTPAGWEIVNPHNANAAHIPIERNPATKVWQKIRLPPEYAAIEFEGAANQNQPTNQAINYVEMDGQKFPVRYDAANNTWRIYRQDRPSAPGIPVKYDPKNGWHIHMNVGLRGGGGLQAKQAELVIVDPGQTRTVTGGEDLTTWGMSDCSTVVLLSGWNAQSMKWDVRRMMHISGSYLRSLNADGVTQQEAGTVLLEWSDGAQAGDCKVIIGYGVNNSRPYGRSAFLAQEYKNRYPLQELISKAQGKVEMYSDGPSLTVSKNGEVRLDKHSGDKIHVPSSLKTMMWSMLPNGV
ncbi:hypothetical protein C7W93_11830 [Glaciimonas sp. PCH181]|nr:hypothetical protein C7W93_11830 [Glaciimonas sp. PCH181]